MSSKNENMINVLKMIKSISLLTVFGRALLTLVFPLHQMEEQPNKGGRTTNFSYIFFFLFLEDYIIICCFGRALFFFGRALLTLFFLFLKLNSDYQGKRQ
jgi:hypothetical protein